MQSGFPGQVNTATTATSQTTGSTSIRYDPTYLHSLPGRLKAAQMVFNLLGFICVLFSTISHATRCGWFNTVAMFGFWMTGILLAFYLFHMVEKLNRIPWLKIEFFFCAAETIAYLITASLIAYLINASTLLGVAAFFGYLAMCAYGFDCWLKFKALQNGDVAQGHRPSSKPVSTVSSPTAY